MSPILKNFLPSSRIRVLQPDDDGDHGGNGRGRDGVHVVGRHGGADEGRGRAAEGGRQRRRDCEEGEAEDGREAGQVDGGLARGRSLTRVWLLSLSFTNTH